MMVPSDCDNRDERFGWTGDSALTADEASVNFDLSSFYDNWARMLDDSSQNGAVSSWVPGGPGHSSPPAGASADASWGSAFPSVVYAQYKWQGDVLGPLQRWKGVTRFIDNEYSRTKTGDCSRICCTNPFPARTRIKPVVKTATTEVLQNAFRYQAHFHRSW